MTAIFEHPHTVSDDEIDGQGHVNNLEYLKWMQTAAVAHSASVGWTTARYRETKAGWVAQRHTIEYLRPAFAGDELVVRTWIAGMRKATSLRKYNVVRVADDAVLSKAETNWAYIGLEHHVPRRIPDEMRDAFTVVAEEDEP